MQRGWDELEAKNPASGRERKLAARGRHLHRAPCAAAGAARSRHMRGSSRAASVAVYGGRIVRTGPSARSQKRHKRTYKKKEPRAVPE